jgi:selenocysteine lyase/cysteine desulfurase
MSLTRRDLLALAASVPAFAGLAGAPLRLATRRALPHDPAQDDEAAWERIAREFVIEGTHLNTGTYGASPLAVLEATIHHLRAFERMIGQEMVDGPALHAELEAFLGAWPGSVAVVRNTTEAMNIVAAGIDLQPGDEVVTTTHEHIGGRCCWELLAKRRGIVLKTFTPPLEPTREADLAAAWMAMVTPRTKVFSISHVLFSTGMIQPVHALVRMARERGIISVIDGAHPPGLLELNLRELDADYYAASPHKWLLAPKGTGLLAMRPDRMANTWPLIASGDWAATGMQRYGHLGTINESLLAGLRVAVAFQQQIGRAAIERRARGLTTLLYEHLSKVPGVEIVSPRRPEFRSAMLAFRMTGTSAEALQAHLGKERIRTRRIHESGLEYLRLSTHIYNVPRDLERTVDVLRTAPRG